MTGWSVSDRHNVYGSYHRERERERDRQTDRRTDRQTETHRKGGGGDGRTDRERERGGGGETDGQTERGGGGERRTDRQTGRDSERERERERCADVQTQTVIKPRFNPLLSQFLRCVKLEVDVLGSSSLIVIMSVDVR